MGTKIDVKNENPIEDTKPVFQYEEKEGNDKTI